MSTPHYPRVGDKWAECYICGDDRPQGTLVMHYKKKRLVCLDCNDEPAQSDILETIILPQEDTDPSIQPVRDQGQAEDLYEDQDVTGGAGLGGQGTGHR